MVTRKTFTTTIDSEVQKRFRVACVQSEQRMNDVLEVLMEYFVANGLPISKEKSD